MQPKADPKAVTYIIITIIIVCVIAAAVYLAGYGDDGTNMNPKNANTFKSGELSFKYPKAWSKQPESELTEKEQLTALEYARDTTFYCNVFKYDEDPDMLMFLYDLKKDKNITINGKQAYLSKNKIEGLTTSKSVFIVDSKNNTYRIQFVTLSSSGDKMDKVIQQVINSIRVN